jgi:septal ring factor EnvC (AmiA/AmiB activator)
MSEITGTETEQTPAEPSTPETGAEQQEQPQPDPFAELEKWKALARQNEARAKANAEKAQQFDALEEANKTELQKAQEAAATAAAEAQQARLDALRARTAASNGVPEDLLVGSNEEELTASVQRLLAFKGTEPAAPRSSGTGTPAGAAKPVVYTAEQLANPTFYQAHRADILAAYSEGRITT